MPDRIDPSDITTASYLFAHPARSLILPLIAPLCPLITRPELVKLPDDAREEQEADVRRLEADPTLATVEARAAVFRLGLRAITRAHRVPIPVVGHWVGDAADLPLTVLVRRAKEWLHD